MMSNYLFCFSYEAVPYRFPLPRGLFPASCHPADCPSHRWLSKMAADAGVVWLTHVLPSEFIQQVPTGG